MSLAWSSGGKPALWRDPRPWLAGFFVALPCSYLLMIASFSVSCTYQRLVNHKVYRWALANGSRGFPPADVPHLPAHCLVLVSRLRGWIGFATNPLGECCSVGSSLLVFSVYVCLQPMLFAVPSAAILGVRRGWQGSRISFRAASVLALTMTVLMISAWSNQALWVRNWALLCPAWYLAATAWRSGQEGPNWFLAHRPCQSVLMFHSR